jgi:hypothetical protein
MSMDRALPNLGSLKSNQRLAPVPRICSTSVRLTWSVPRSMSQSSQGGQSASDVLRLTKMNWNNDGLYDRLPVTLGHAQTLARVVKRMPILSSRPYAIRFFI